ncbi:MAG: hypothetical protein JWP00_2497 [Chloroflexi bacterium]|nr:hypothetical protein [Chloroflexota bacterium]
MIGLRQLVGRFFFLTGLPTGLAVCWLAVTVPAAQAGQGGGQNGSAADGTVLWTVAGLVVLMLAAGVGLLYTRRKK